MGDPLKLALCGVMLAGIGGCTGNMEAPPCGTDRLCMSLKLLDGAAPLRGRLGVLWQQLGHDQPDLAPEVAYDVPLPSGPRVDVPLAQLAPPGPLKLHCPRACPDESMCPCTGDPRVGVALVVVGEDVNLNGQLDVTGPLNSRDKMVGLGYVVLGWAAASSPATQLPVVAWFTDGVTAGVAPYAVMKVQGSSDQLRKAPPETLFDLNVCAKQDGTCIWPFLNLR